MRILLIGDGAFVAGTLGFPCMSDLRLMIFCCILIGFGAGTVFLGIAKFLGDLYSEKFALALGMVLLISDFGSVFGTMPMVHLVEAMTAYHFSPSREKCHLFFTEKQNHLFSHMTGSYLAGRKSFSIAKCNRKKFFI